MFYIKVALMDPSLNERNIRFSAMNEWKMCLYITHIEEHSLSLDNGFA